VEHGSVVHDAGFFSWQVFSNGRTENGNRVKLGFGRCFDAGNWSLKKLACLTSAVSFLLGMSAVAVALHSGNNVGNATEATKSSTASLDQDVVRNLNTLDSRDVNETTTYEQVLTTTNEEVLTTTSLGERVELKLTACKDRWSVRYIDPVGQEVQRLAFDVTSKPEDNATVHLPANSVVRLNLRSCDFVYMLSLPQIHKSQIAVPDRNFRIDIRTLSPGMFFLPGGHVCGPPKPLLTLAVRVDPRPAFIAWLEKQSRSADSHPGNDP
jgi:heme/copper-type cytochrome/quinol oxidase subunit 2